MTQSKPAKSLVKSQLRRSLHPFNSPKIKRRMMSLTPGLSQLSSCKKNWFMITLLSHNNFWKEYSFHHIQVHIYLFTFLLLPYDKHRRDKHRSYTEVIYKIENSTRQKACARGKIHSIPGTNRQTTLYPLQFDFPRSTNPLCYVNVELIIRNKEPTPLVSYSGSSNDQLKQRTINLPIHSFATLPTKMFPCY